MNHYKVWLDAHIKKRDKIVAKLGIDNKDSLLEYFMFENLAKKEVDFCPLFENNTKCHEVESLNCFFCVCPYFIFFETPLEEDGMFVHSRCSVDSIFGDIFVDGKDIHLDCTKCIFPHKKRFVARNI